MKKLANLRVCASCEWIFKLSEFQACPKCGFAHYGAFYVYGDRCYKFAKTQEPWFNRKVDKYKVKLWQEISAPNKGLHADVGESAALEGESTPEVLSTSQAVSNPAPRW